MALNKFNLMLLHTVPKGLGISDEHRRLIQLNHGGVESAAKMNYAGFVRCMAFYESQGYEDRGRGRGYWRKLAGDAAAPLRAKAIKLADIAGWLGLDGRVDFVRLNGFVAKQTKGRPTPRARLFDCDAADLDAVIEGLKAIILQDPQRAAQLKDSPRRHEGREGARRTDI